MPAPTALKKEAIEAPAEDVPLPQADVDEEMLLDASDATPFVQPNAPSLFEPSASGAADGTDETMALDEESRPRFQASRDADPVARRDSRKVMIPPNRVSRLKTDWPRIYTPLVEACKLAVRYNPKRKVVEMRTSSATPDGCLQKGEDFVRAYCMGFDVEDAVALIRLDDLYIQSFQLEDVKLTLKGDHLARAIGRVAGNGGKVKLAVENTCKVRIQLSGSHVHILGGFKQIGIAREMIVSLVLGKPVGKVYNNLRTVSSRMKERF